MSEKVPFQYEKKFEVLSFQIDPEGRLRMSALADLMQEVAWKHADSRDFGKALFYQGYIWVLSRFEIKFNKMPSGGEEIIVNTAGRGIDKLFALREFLVVSATGEVLAEAISAWLLLEIKTKRPQRPGNVLPPELFSYIDGSQLMPDKIHLPEKPAFGDLIKVRPFDLDMNNHVNNVSYIRWVEDFCLIHKTNIEYILINYLAEALLNQEIEIYYQVEEDSTILIGKNQNKQVFLAKVNKQLSD
jgi:acyl-ACP thioesterase